MHITLKQLAVFKAVCDTHQISRAAKALHLSAPAVSMQLKELEATLGCRLFERHANGLALNESGRLAQQYANDMLAKAEQLQALFRDQKAGLGGTLRIGATKVAGNYVLSRRIPRFKSLYPAVNVRLKIGSSQSIETMLSGNELDLAFLDHLPEDTALESRPWRNDRLCVVASPKSKLYRRTVTPESLSEATWILDEEGSTTRTEALKLLQQLGIVVKEEIVMNTMGALKRAVDTGLGLGVFPLLAIDAELERGDLVEIIRSESQVTRPLFIAYRRDNAPELVKKFLASADFLDEEIG